MVFNSYIFIIVFLPLFLLAFYFVSKFSKSNKAVFAIIIIASLLFYASDNSLMSLFLIGSILFNYLFHILISKNQPKLWLTLGILINLGVLLFTKYLDFGISIINMLCKTSFSIKNYPAPLGISFITFQQIAFLVYAYRHSKEKVEFAKYSVYSSFFPHIAQGPILDPAEYLEDKLNKQISGINWSNFSSGILLFSIGLAKKVLLADVYATLVDTAYINLENLNLGSSIFVSLAYTLQIYFDFSGYCDMAMGIGKMVNIDLPINFNSPYKAKTIDEFWDRWHITLTRFFTKYVYIPLGGNRKGTVRTLINIMIVFLISGLWHGASLTFVLWGAVHGILMVISRLLKDSLKKVPAVISQIITFLLVNFAWVLFRARTLTNLRVAVKGFTNKGLQLLPEIVNSFDKIGIFNLGKYSNSWTTWLFLLIGLVIVFSQKNSVELVERCKWTPASAIAALALLLICVFSFTGTSTYVYLMF